MNYRTTPKMVPGPVWSTVALSNEMVQWKIIHNLRPREPLSKEEKKTVLKKKKKTWQEIFEGLGLLIPREK